jgi:hypothetical protein
VKAVIGMSKRRLVWFVIVLCLCVTLVLASPHGRRGLIGLCKGESFYAGMPSSYWRDAVQTWDASRPSSRRLSFLPSKVRAFLKLDAYDGHPPFYRRAGKTSHAPEADPASISVLIDLVDDPDVRVRLYALATLRDLGPRASRAASFLVKRLRDDPDAGFRRKAAWTLGVIGCDVPATVQPALRKALNDKDESVRANADWALQQFESARN